jgi:hypothetical protein
MGRRGRRVEGLSNNLHEVYLSLGFIPFFVMKIQGRPENKKHKFKE